MVSAYLCTLEIGLQRHPFETLVSIRSPKLSNVDECQYIDEGQLGNIRCCELECMSGAMDNGSKMLIGHLSCKSISVRYIFLRINILWKTTISRLPYKWVN